VLRIRDVYPGSRVLIVFYPIPRSNNKKRKKNKVVVLPFCSHKFQKFKMIKFFNKYRKRFESNDKDFKYFIPNILLTPSELCGLDPGSQKSIADPDIGIKKHRIPDPPHWI
jgi:hypothetical protein